MILPKNWMISAKADDLFFITIDSKTNWGGKVEIQRKQYMEQVPMGENIWTKPRLNIHTLTKKKNLLLGL